MSELIDWLKPGTQSRPAARPQTGTRGALQDQVFETPGGPLAGKLMVPVDVPASPGLVVLLHGCSQTPLEFAVATRMAEHAEAAGFLIFFPAQCSSRNTNRCWNWFAPGHRQRGSGEPALIAHAVRAITAAHDVDRRRIYIAGLSAGGAMAVTMGQAYPDLFAAVGVHSGLAHGTATGAVSALDVMRRGPTPDSRSALGPRVPTIVFHGDADNIVHAANGKRIIEQCVGSTASGQGQRHESGRGGYARTVFTDGRGQVLAEYWEIAGGGHAWSGGKEGASYSDPGGPDASREMLRFFDAQRLCPRVATFDIGQDQQHSPLPRARPE